MRENLKQSTESLSEDLKKIVLEAYESGLRDSEIANRTSNNINNKTKEVKSQYEKRREDGMVKNKKRVFLDSEEIENMLIKISPNIYEKFIKMVGMMDNDNVVCGKNGREYASIKYLCEYFNVNENTLRYKILSVLEKERYIKIISNNREVIVINPRYALRSKFITPKLYMIFKDECDELLYDDGVRKFEEITNEIKKRNNMESAFINSNKKITRETKKELKKFLNDIRREKNDNC